MIEPISSLRKEGSRFATFLRHISNSLAERVLRNEFGDHIKVICHASLHLEGSTLWPADEEFARQCRVKQSLLKYQIPIRRQAGRQHHAINITMPGPGVTLLIARFKPEVLDGFDQGKISCEA